MREKTQTKTQPSPVFTSILLAALALVCVAATTVAWFSIADQTRVHAMSMDVTSGVSLRFDLDEHESFEDYVKTLQFEQIAARILSDKGFSMEEEPLVPVTTEDCVTFTLENGTEVTDVSGSYLEFTLHFMALESMVVHLTSANSADGDDGTLVSSGVAALPEAMRISFTADDTTIIYDPGMSAGSTTANGIKTFGLASASAMTYTDDNALFSLDAEVDKPVVLRVWLEGTDDACTDDLRSADYSIQLRFQGTDEDNIELDGAA